jgi:uncharacterized protein (TIGR03437 family)
MLTITSLMLLTLTAHHSQPDRTLPIYFEANQGQAESHVQFISRRARHSLFIRDRGGATFCYPEGNLEMKLAGGGGRSRGLGIEPLPGAVNYFVGSDSYRWRTGVTAYSGVKFNRVYQGIDLIYHGRNGRLEYDFAVSPGADPSAILLEFAGAQKMEVGRGGNLALSLPAGTVEHRKPAAYQISVRGRHEIAVHYVLVDGRRVRFKVADYDRRLPLVIDPVISFSTFFGGGDNDGAFSVALDRDGNIYFAGITASVDLPKTTGSVPGKAYAGTTDAFVVKLNPFGTSLIYATYLGGSDNDTVMAVAVDSTGSAYVTGGTNSRDFPTTAGALQPRFGGTGGHSFPPFSHPSGDGFVAKLSPAGSTLVYSTYLGGPGVDQGYGIAVDSAGAAYIAGATESPNFPVTEGAFQSTLHGFPDVFIAKINSSGSGLLYSTFLGGSRENYGFALALDSDGNAYVTGITSSDDFPTTPGAFQSRRLGSVTGFVAKLSTTRNSLMYSTYLGSTGRTEAYGIAADSAGSAYVTGTTAAGFPVTAGAFQSPSKPGAQGGDVFVAKLNPAGNSAVYSSVFGGNGPDAGTAIAVDISGNAYITGRTRPYGNGRWIDFPTTREAVQRCGTGNPSAFLVRLDASGSTLQHSTYLAGVSGGSTATAIALGPGIFVAGSTNMRDFPVTNGVVQTSYAGSGGDFDSTNLYPVSGDAFVTRFELSAESPPFKLSCEANAANLAPNLVSPGEIVSIFGTRMAPVSPIAASLDDSGRFPKTLGGVRILFDGAPAPLLYVSADQINAVAPFGLAGKTTTQIQLEYGQIKSEPLNVRVTGLNPGIFTIDSSGSGQAAVLNEDGSVNSSTNPANPGSIVVLFATGAGLLDPQPEDGAVTRGTPPQAPSTLAYVGAGCMGEVLYSGSAPELVAGAIQINIRLPDDPRCGAGNVPVLLLIGGAPTQQLATVSVK